MTTPNYVVIVLAAMGLILLAVRIFVWQWSPRTRPCKLFGHDKKYVAIRTYSVVALNSPNSNPLTCSHGHKIGEKGIYEARWSCRRCPLMGEDCLGKKQDWTIEHEKLVPDVKKWTNWSQNPPSPPEPPTAAREKLAQIQKRLDTEKCAAYCEGCGLMHTGGPCPGGLS